MLCGTFNGYACVLASKKFRTDVTQIKNTDVTQMAQLW
jgi:hypothetical protein